MINRAGTRIETALATRFLSRAAGRAALYALQVARAKGALPKVIPPDRASGSSAGSSRETSVDGADGEAVAANIDQTALRKHWVSEAARLAARRSAGLNERLA